MDKLSKSISLQELQELRAEGLSNKQIADRLDISYQTVLKYLGKADFRAPYGSCKKPEDVPEEKKEVLTELFHIKELAGNKNKYRVNIADGTVTVTPISEGNTIQVMYSTYTKADLQRHVAELLDIMHMI